jgi:DNA-binding transcriptional LysR family regulator
MLDMRQLQALKSLAETGSIVGAARELQWSQPTVTHHLRSLGKTLGRPVVVSDSRGTTLSPAGQELLPFASEILALATRAERELTVSEADYRTLRLGVLPSIGGGILPPVLRRLRDDGLVITVLEAESNELVALVASFAIDMAIVLAGPTLHERLPPQARFTFLMREKLLLLLPLGHKLAGPSRVGFAETVGELWVMSPDPEDSVDLALKHAAARHGFAPGVSVLSDDYSVIQGYVAAGLGVALIPESALAGRRQDVAVAEIADEVFTRDLGVVIGAHAPRQEVASLVAGLQAHVKSRPQRKPASAFRP